ncbi:MAG: hypothetical protein IJ716_00375 [Lachnospiraceae bacterium]|nr:hypothetical protein [Lachnospiraceae bacterium]
MDSMLSISFKTISNFMEAAGGNFRSSIYVSCRKSCEAADGCQDFLFIPGRDCKPIIFPIKDAEQFFHMPIDPSECAGIMSSSCFLLLYRKYLDMELPSDGECPIKELLHRANSEKIGNNW